MINLLKEPEVWQESDTGLISEIYVIDASNIFFNLNSKPFELEKFILEIKKTQKKEIENIFISFENIPSQALLDISEVVDISTEDKIKLVDIESVTTVFAIKQEALEKYAKPFYAKMKSSESIFDLKDDNGSIIILNFKYYEIKGLFV
ncbi:MAG: hypothetical protein U0457_19385 [Candidatus Sericytochromatia bacterium]